MTNTIAISGLSEAPLQHLQIEIDDYVPLRFRSYEGVLGVQYVRWGNFSTSLLEFLLDPSSMAIRGLTLLCFDAVHQPRVTAALPQTSGLPVVGGFEAFDGPVGAQRVDIGQSFSVGFGEDFLEIDLGLLSEAERVIAAGPVRFYVNQVGLMGVRVVDLTKQQLSMVSAQLTR